MQMTLHLPHVLSFQLAWPRTVLVKEVEGQLIVAKGHIRLMHHGICTTANMIRNTNTSIHIGTCKHKHTLAQAHLHMNIDKGTHIGKLAGAPSLQHQTLPTPSRCSKADSLWVVNIETPTQEAKSLKTHALEQTCRFA